MSDYEKYQELCQAWRKEMFNPDQDSVSGAKRMQKLWSKIEALKNLHGGRVPPKPTEQIINKTH